MKKKLTLLIVGVLAIWAATLGTAFLIPHQVCASTRAGTGGIGNTLPDNCAWVGSCGPKLGTCYRLGFGGGSQWTYDNHIPACLQEGRDCYSVKCHVKQWSNETCTGTPDDDTQVDRTGCKKK